MSRTHQNLPVLSTHLAALALLVAAVSCPAGASAQTATAAVVGDVADSSQARLVGASVTLTNEATNISTVQITNSAGEFRAARLPVGTYTVAVSARGFGQYRRTGVILEIDSTVKLDVVLSVGDAGQTVEVTGAPPLLQTQDTSVGAVINQTEIDRLPINGRNYTRLILLSPGVSDRGRAEPGHVLRYSSIQCQRPAAAG